MVAGPRNQRNHKVTGNWALAATVQNCPIRGTASQLLNRNLLVGWPSQEALHDWPCAWLGPRHCRIDPSWWKHARAASASAALPRVLRFRPARHGRCDGMCGTRSFQVPTADLSEPGSLHESNRRDRGYPALFLQGRMKEIPAIRGCECRDAC